MRPDKEWRGQAGRGARWTGRRAAGLIAAPVVVAALLLLTSLSGLDVRARIGSAALDVLQLRAAPASTAAKVAQRASSTPSPTAATALGSPLATPNENAVMAAPFVLPTVTPTPLFRSGIRRTSLSGLSHEWQTWNNCGPATLSMALSFFGHDLGQAAIGPVLRPNPEDKNVAPQELAAYARTLGLRSLVRVNGDAGLVKRLISNGLPVLVEVWLEPEPGDGFGHYRLLTGYDDDAQMWTAYDSYVAEGLINLDGAYAGIAVPYAQLAQQWRVYNGTYVVLYPAEAEQTVRYALGDQFDDDAMWTATLARAQAEIDTELNDAFAWFNRSTALVELQRYAEAAEAYERAAAIGLPWRMLWYQFGPLEAYYRTGRYAEVVALADRTLATTRDVEELHYWRGLALAALGDADGARASLQNALALRPAYADAAEALAQL